MGILSLCIVLHAVVSSFAKYTSGPGSSRSNGLCGVPSKYPLPPELVKNERLSIDFSLMGSAMAVWTERYQVLWGVLLTDLPRNNVVDVDFSKGAVWNRAPVASFHQYLASHVCGNC